MWSLKDQFDYLDLNCDRGMISKQRIDRILNYYLDWLNGILIARLLIKTMTFLKIIDAVVDNCTCSIVYDFVKGC